MEGIYQSLFRQIYNQYSAYCKADIVWWLVWYISDVVVQRGKEGI